MFDAELFCSFDVGRAVATAVETKNSRRFAKERNVFVNRLQAKCRVRSVLAGIHQIRM